MSEDMGLIHVYTGDGKGKTTASLGLAVRARSRGMRVLFAQFMKDTEGGETEMLEKLGIRVVRFTSVLSPHFHPRADRKSIRHEILKALVELRGMLAEFDLAVLDEFNYLMMEDLITPAEAVGFLREKPEALELAVTGRGAAPEVIEMADLVTEMREIKHPSTRGVGPRPGTEY